jgi:hypothetical protein
MLDWLTMMGWEYVPELLPPPALLFIPQVIYERGEPWWWWCRLGMNPNSSTRALWQSYQQRYLGHVGGLDEGVRILPIQYLRYLTGNLRCRKISRFAFLPKEGVLRIFIAFKNPSPRPGLNLRPLGPVVSTLTTTPPRRHPNSYCSVPMFVGPRHWNRP